VPLLIGLDLYSRRLFNEVFYRTYRGMRHEWLAEMAEGLFESVIRPAVYPGSKKLVEGDRSDGLKTVLVTGSLDFALAPVVRFYGFDHVISNRLQFAAGVATGELEPPLIAEKEKVEAMLRLCRQYNVDSAESKAYSDSMSDLPMLEAVGQPSAVNPDRRLRHIALERGWPVIHLR
jgi:HAD superfamily hydrolase (TIGR01490 family)